MAAPHNGGTFVVVSWLLNAGPGKWALPEASPALRLL